MTEITCPNCNHKELETEFYRMSTMGGTVMYLPKPVVRGLAKIVSALKQCKTKQLFACPCCGSAFIIP